MIGDYDEETRVIKNPVVMIPVNKEQIAFQPWLPYAEDKEYTLKEEQINVVANPSTTIKNEYSRIYGSGIVVPNNASDLLT